MVHITLHIADLRKKQKVTQQELADNIGVTFQTIHMPISITAPHIRMLFYPG